MGLKTVNECSFNFEGVPRRPTAVGRSPPYPAIGEFRVGEASRSPIDDTMTNGL